MEVWIHLDICDYSYRATDTDFRVQKNYLIHNNPLQRSTLVRILSEFLKQKMLDKNIWYVGDSMFHTAQWSSEHSSSTPPLSSIKIWAHLTRVLLDLRYQHGFSLVAGLIGEPKETDDFTLNLVNLILSHVKVEVDLTKPLPSVVEFVRQSGEVVEVLVSYPWLPPKCTHCHELGHVVRNCLTYIPPKAPPASSASVATGNAASAKKRDSAFQQKPMKKPVVNMQFLAVKTKVTKASSSSPSNTPARSPKTVSLPTSPLVPTSLNLDSFTATKTFHPSTESPSDKPQKPSLKRSRSSPTFSPPSHPKVTYQSSNTIQMSLFPEVGTLKYLVVSPFIDHPQKNSLIGSSPKIPLTGPVLKNPFLPLQNVDSLQSAGEPLFSS